MQLHTYQILFDVQKQHWWFVSRRKILSALINRYCEKKESLKILDVGCGTGVNLNLLKQFGNVVGLDNEPEALRFCKEHGFKETVLGDVRAMPFSEGEFDIVIAMDIVEHLDDDIAVLKEIYRVLKPGGLAFLFVPAFMFLWSIQDEVSLHKRRYRLPEFKKRVLTAGYKIFKISYANFFLFPLILFLRYMIKLLRIKLDSENRVNPKLTNGLMTAIFSSEAYLLSHLSFPFGVSIICVAKREGK